MILILFPDKYKKIFAHITHNWYPNEKSQFYRNFMALVDNRNSLIPEPTKQARNHRDYQVTPNMSKLVFNIPNKVTSNLNARVKKSVKERISELEIDEEVLRLNYPPSAFHESTPEIRREKAINKVKFEQELLAKKDDFLLLLKLANCNLFLAPTNKDLPNSNIVVAKELCQRAKRINYFSHLVHSIESCILFCEKVYFTRIDQIKAVILAIRRTLAISPDQEKTVKSLQNLTIATQLKMELMLEDNEISQEDYDDYMRQLQACLDQDPFEGEDIPPEQLAQAPEALKQKYPSLNRKPDFAAAGRAKRAATTVARKVVTRDKELRELGAGASAGATPIEPKLDVIATENADRETGAALGAGASQHVAPVAGATVAAAEVPEARVLDSQEYAQYKEDVFIPSSVWTKYEHCKKSIPPDPSYKMKGKPNIFILDDSQFYQIKEAIIQLKAELVGLPEEVIARLPDPFFALKNTAKRDSL